MRGHLLQKLGTVGPGRLVVRLLSGPEHPGEQDGPPAIPERHQQDAHDIHIPALIDEQADRLVRCQAAQQTTHDAVGNPAAIDDPREVIFETRSYEVSIILQTAGTYLLFILRDLFGEYLRYRAIRQQQEQQVNEAKSIYKKALLQFYFLWKGLMIDVFERRMISPIAQAHTTKEVDLTSRRFDTTQVIQVEGDIHHTSQIVSDIVIELDHSISPDKFPEYIHALNTIRYALVESDMPL